MKKIIYLITGFVFLASISFSQSQSITKSITITKPVAGAVWAKNTAHLIEWRFVGDINENVKIRLFSRDGRTRIKSITDRTPTNNRNFRCQPNFFNDVPDGLYIIRVKTVDDEVTGNSTPFTIGAPPTIIIKPEESSPLQPPLTPAEILKRKFGNLGEQQENLPPAPRTINITYPNKDTKWRLKLGNTSLDFPIRVQWEKGGVWPQEGRVKIILFRKIQDRYMRKKIILTQNTRNSGLYTGAISRDLRTSMYTIIIETLDGKIRSESKMFYIVNAENDPH